MNHWLLVDFCDWIDANGFSSIPQDILSQWGLEGTSGTYTGSLPCPNGTTLFLSLGEDSGGASYVSGACAKLTRAGEQDDLVRIDWRLYAPMEKDKRPHIHLDGSRIFLDEDNNWQRVRETVVQLLENELGPAYLRYVSPEDTPRSSDE